MPDVIDGSYADEDLDAVRFEAAFVSRGEFRLAFGRCKNRLRSAKRPSQKLKTLYKELEGRLKLSEREYRKFNI